MKRTLLLSGLLLLGCNEASIGTIKPHGEACGVLEPLAFQQDCKEINGGVQCSMGDLAPESWGLCIEDKNREFTCLKGETISHYKDGPRPVWSKESNKCPLMKQQLKDTGKDHDEVPLILAPPEETNYEKKTA